MKRQHTPTPWRISEVFGRGHKNHIAGADDHQVSDCESYKKSLVEQEANAALIVKAVNRDHLFDELTMALADLFQLHQEATGKIKLRHNPKEDIEDYYKRVEKRTSAILAKVKP